MKYFGSRLAAYVTEKKGNYAEICERMTKYKKTREGSKETPYRIESLYGDGLNLTLSTLTALMKETGKPITYFVDFESHELPEPIIQPADAVIECSDDRLKHLQEILRLKEEIIALKDREIESLRRELESTRTKTGH